MMSKIHAIFTGCFRQNNRKQFTVQRMEGVKPQASSSTADIMDTALFTNDHGVWFGKCVFQFLFAMVVRDENTGRSGVNPKDVLTQVESSYMGKPGEYVGRDGSTHYPGIILFERINAARAAKNEKAFQFFLDNLSSNIKHHYDILRNGDTAELEAGHINTGPHRSELSLTSTPTGNYPSSEVRVGRITNPPTPNSSPPTVPLREELPLHTYTTLLKMYAPKSGESPQHNPRLDYDSGLWCYEITLGAVRGVGKALTKKEAEHMASRHICHALNIGSR
ncbi:hypothetical protein DE146DRAFT_767256 [Phaeosphaeria sp. MPI-PUGE-AT-0046c]|nr:hypothetical protein DE146DRAFT_767256 [Phaeosphaeria sp. MPI-PUGE-AT-0046c]